MRIIPFLFYLMKRLDNLWILVSGWGLGVVTLLLFFLRLRVKA